MHFKIAFFGILLVLLPGLSTTASISTLSYEYRDLLEKVYRLEDNLKSAIRGLSVPQKYILDIFLGLQGQIDPFSANYNEPMEERDFDECAKDFDAFLAPVTNLLANLFIIECSNGDGNICRNGTLPRLPWQTWATACECVRELCSLQIIYLLGYKMHFSYLEN